ncbi:acylneuraminate cytidylyltransferase [Microbacterium stercoris]|uniref:N-acylneuraminate cytidylyltransferase n=1 Tax=Microbacterium stercoris TaxID=2820289 RepID=A0A939QST9_9MICO|nr:acylneuraminate cytidylyltransferase [Microbacterium stercoris]MBO3664016.1 acylneuraminate cytidylyltransferase [Microbacterium stercoris]
MTDQTAACVAVIPARGGSKGVPRKNVLPVGGVPLVVRAVNAARAARGIDMVVVSTDDDEIAALALSAGARVIRRPAEIAGDTASSEAAVLHALDALEADGVRPRATAFLQATSPFIDSSALAEAVRRVMASAADSVFSAVPTYGFLWERTADGMRGLGHHEAHRPRRQDREPHHQETGAFYVFDTAGFRRARHRFFGRIDAVEVPELGAIEIDSRSELDAARALAPLIDVAGAIDVDAVVTDFDGVHTDDTAILRSDGLESVRVSRADGMGVGLLREAGVPVLILSTETDPVVAARARKLRVEVRQGVEDKAAVLREWATVNGLALDRIAYVGNDVNDLGCLDIVGWPVVVPEAHAEVRARARVVLERRGGDGAVRDLARRVLAARAATPQIVPASAASAAATSLDTSNTRRQS